MQSPAVEGIPPPIGRGEGQCSEEGEVTAVGGGVRSNDEMGGHCREERRGAAVTPSPPQQFGRRLEGCPQLSSGWYGRQACTSPLASRRARVVWAAEGGLSSRAPIPPKLTSLPPLRGPNLPPNVCPASSREMGDESGARILRLRGCHGQGEGGETVGRGKAGPVLPRALDRLSAPSTPPRAAESGAVTGEGDAGEEGPRGSRGSLGMLRKGEGRHLPDARLRTCQGRNAQSRETPNAYLRRNRRGRRIQGGGPQG